MYIAVRRIVAVEMLSVLWAHALSLPLCIRALQRDPKCKWAAAQALPREHSGQ